MSNEDWYVYMNIDNGGLCRLNLSKLCEESTRPEFEHLHKFRRSRSPSIVHLFNDSNTILQFQLPRREYYWNFATSIDDKLYVLSSHYQVFQVFDPLHRLWKNLPLPPSPSSTESYMPEKFEWGHMIAIFQRSYEFSDVFDTVEEKWMVAEGLPCLTCALEFQGFLIGKPRFENQNCLVAYKLDENGLPNRNSRQNIHGLWEIFYPPIDLEGNGFSRDDGCFLNRFGDDGGRICFLSTTRWNKEFLLVAVFRLSISTICGIPVVDAVFEHKLLYKLVGGVFNLWSCKTITSCFVIQLPPNSSSYQLGSMPPIMLDNLPSDEDDDEYNYISDHDEDDENHASNDNDAKISAPEAQTSANELTADTERKWDFADTVWDDGIKDKSLYFCFVEQRTDFSFSYVIKAMKFSDVLSSSPSQNLCQVASTSGWHLASPQRCGVFGSQILFAGSGYENFHGYENTAGIPRTDIHVFDVTSMDSTNANHGYDNIKSFTKSFEGLKPEPLLAEVEGKLYALAGYPIAEQLNPGPFFEVLDPIEKEWSQLPDPPPYTLYAPHHTLYAPHRYSHAIAGTNILVTSHLSPGVFRFDVADHIHREWRLIEKSGFTFGGNTTLVVATADDCGGDFVLFTYCKSSNAIGVYLMSREFDSIVYLPPLELPESVSSFLEAAQDGYNHGHSSFVHLGGRRVCLVLSSLFEGPYNMYNVAEVDKISVSILGFEFEVTENRDSLVATFLFHRVLEYDINSSTTLHTKQKQDNNSKTSDINMVGAFLL